MTLQELFDKALIGIRAQGGPAVLFEDGIGKCLYRSPEGNKCAIGHNIPDEEYNPAMGSRGIVTLCSDFMHYPSIREMKILIGVETLADLQSAHDLACWGRAALKDADGTVVGVDKDLFLADFELRMKEFAEQYALTYTPKEPK
jgi:hypothetical protein